MAEAFLSQLAPDETHFTFQVFRDSSESIVRPEHFHGTLADHAPRLSAANDAGAGVFVMINQGDGRGRKAENVLRVRANFVDLDGSPLQPLLDCGLPPQIVVETSPNRWHAYWRTNCPTQRFSEVQRALSERFQGDRSVSDLPRVMRLPGFMHRKRQPWLVRLTDLNDLEQPRAIA